MRALSIGLGRLSKFTFSRHMSTKVICHAYGPDRMGILKEMTQVINDNGGTIHDTRATSLGGLFSVTTEVAVKEDSAAMSFALQSALNDYHVVVRPETEMEAAPQMFGRIEVTKAPALAVLSNIMEHATSSGINLSTLRTDECKDSLGTHKMTATLSSTKPVDIKWIEQSILELGVKYDCCIEFEKL